MDSLSDKRVPHIAPLEIFKIVFEIISNWYVVWRSQFSQSSSSPYRHDHRHYYLFVAIFTST